ncbi:hypothetical protein [Aeromonas veronii]|uniref:hypothetical protein n=1 Tax=Aeromonas veronii TaxID=654 RepID=UPI00241641E9|nr:hypothetical protein [Aeromonas veronii]WFO52532.1 hypothetical protein L1O00_05840 [Aeromonas veronii]
MSKKDFENLLKKHQTESEKNAIDWDARKKEWLEFINVFYKKIENWLEPYKQQGTVSYTYKNVSITEEFIGTYDVRVMTIIFAEQKLTLEPLGTLLIGTKGRIDMDGVMGRVQFILADKDITEIKFSSDASSQKEKEKKPDWTWKIVLRDSRKISFVEFNEINFFDSIMEVVNG